MEVIKKVCQHSLILRCQCNNDLYIVLIHHNNLGTKHKSHQRLITIRHENGVIVLHNE